LNGPTRAQHRAVPSVLPVVIDWKHVCQKKMEAWTVKTRDVVRKITAERGGA